MQQGGAPAQQAPQDGGGLAQQGQQQNMQQAVEQVIALLQQGHTPEELIKGGIPAELVKMAVQMLQQEAQQQGQGQGQPQGLAGQGMA